jgi:hypothetical protein
MGGSADRGDAVGLCVQDLRLAVKEEQMIPLSRDQSRRSASTGSSRLARRAGMLLAIRWTAAWASGVFPMADDGVLCGPPHSTIKP